MPVDEFRVLTMAGALGVSRSSCYWYFDDVDELRSGLPEIWRTNTQSILERSRRDTTTPTATHLVVFECWTDPRLFDVRLDLAMRLWGRRRPDAARRLASAWRRSPAPDPPMPSWRGSPSSSPESADVTEVAQSTP